VQVRRKGQYVSQTFPAHADAKRRAAEIERNIDVGRPVLSPASRDARTLADLVALHVTEMCDVWHSPLRSKARALEMLSHELGDRKVHQIYRDTPAKVVWRAKIILATAHDLGTMAIYKESGKTKKTVWRWQERWRAPARWSRRRADIRQRKRAPRRADAAAPGPRNRCRPDRPASTGRAAAA
jgi:hypothetical protein